MASQEEILTILSRQTAAISAPELSKELKEEVARFNIQLKRLIEKNFIEQTEQGYLITEEGRKQLYKHTQVGEGMTDYDQFRNIGQEIGIATDALDITVAHVFRGGDYKDLSWVWQALGEMAIRQDLKTRWWHAWRSYLGQGVPPEMKGAVATSGDDKKGEAASTHLRDYILTKDNIPVNVGEGYGDLDYKDAVDLAKIRAARGVAGSGPAGAQATVGSYADELAKVVKAAKELVGENKGKSYLLKPSEDGYTLEEYDANKPLVVNAPGGTNKKAVVMVHDDGRVEDLESGKPVVIIKEGAPPAQQKTLLVDKSTGKTEEVTAGQPIIIIRESPPQQGTPIQLKDKDGNPIVLDIGSYIKLEEHHDKQRREDESHEVKMEIGKAFKDMLGKAGKALGNIFEEKEEEE